MGRIKLIVEYVGTGYCGWQSQKNGVSVQDTLEKALAQFLHKSFVRVYAAGRTDVGVHARGQTVHLDVDEDVNPFKLCLGVNLLLPPDLSVVDAAKVSDDFDARFDAVDKTYCYRMYVSPTRRPTLDVFCLQVYKMPDVSAMREGAKLLVGRHDFAAFQNSGSNLKGTVRTVNGLDVVQKGSVLEFWVNGTAFLYNQVRNMCGLLLEVGYGLPLSAVGDMLQGKRVRYKTLPAKGLTLEKVNYEKN
ncbi:MAG TPA: tRNA pseudouridine(38-40) synthase TruA [Candidatus Fimimonas merdipullorum]|uniref:tRNA pseudouridine synthase A n=1 Tax=Candidatus Fimimonas merdipullorum TaxID=2840822 RepID=A0A9D1MXG5_9BACT|nr:tRNA pseudouridine(38-40) synthase TruA [Candidatus Fimimonas merdipullorum]